MGTSLKVDGIKHLVKDVAKTVKSNGGVCILINRDPVGKEFDAFFDWFLEGDVDFFSTTIQDGIKELIEKENKSVKIEKKVVKVEKAVKEKSVKEETVKSVKIEKTVKAKIVKKVTKKAKKEPKNGKIEFPTQKAISRKENISG